MSAREYVEITSFNEVAMRICGDCGALVSNPEFHDAWHDNLTGGFKAAREAIDELGDVTVHALKARDVETLRLFDALLGKKPRAPYKWPQTAEERAEIEAIMRDLGIDKDVDVDVDE